MNRRENPGWGYLIFDAAVMCAIMLAVSEPSQVIATIGDLGVGHGAGDIALALFAVVGLLVVVLISAVALFAPRMVKVARPPTRADDLEERRAWLADLREQGVPWHQRLVQRLSLTFVAAPIMAVRRGARTQAVPWTPRRRVQSFALNVIAVVLAFTVRDGFTDPWPVAITLAVVLALVGAAQLLIGVHERRQAR